MRVIDLERKRIGLSMRMSPKKALHDQNRPRSAVGKKGSPRNPSAKRKNEKPGKPEEKLDPSHPFVRAFKKANWRPG